MKGETMINWGLAAEMQARSVGTKMNTQGKDMREYLTFGDVLLRPKLSRIRSRSEVKIGVELCKGFQFALPFIPANMKSVVSLELASKMYRAKGLVLLHRFLPLKDQLQMLAALVEEYGPAVYRSVGV